MSLNLNKAYSEVCAILNLLEREYVDKIPKKFIIFIESKKDTNYTPVIRPDIPLENQNLLQDTINILAMLKLDYWCSDEDEKKELLNILNQNEQDYQKQLHEKYNPYNLFNNKKENIINSVSEETSLVEAKEMNFISKIFDKIRRMFKIRR